MISPPTQNDNAKFPAPGIYVNLPAKVYNSDTKATRNSDLSLIHRSPSHLKHRPESGAEKDTPSLAKGRLLHAMMEARLKGDAHLDGFAIYTGTRRGKNWDAFKSEHTGKEIVTLSEYQALEGPVEVLASLPLFHDNEVVTEVTAVAELDGVLVKARADALLVDGPMAGTIVDYKTTRDASPGGFLKSVGLYRYDQQAALYTEVFRRAGVAVNRFLFAAVELDPPCATAVYELDHIIVNAGAASYMDALKTLKRCRQSGVWPGYTQEAVTVLDAPDYGRLAAPAVTFGGEVML